AAEFSYLGRGHCHCGHDLSLRILGFVSNACSHRGFHLMVAIQAKHLSKVYRWYARRTDLIKELLVLNRKQYHAKRVAIDGVSFEVRMGECVGIIGRKGLGTRTVLRLPAVIP